MYHAKVNEFILKVNGVHTVELSAPTVGAAVTRRRVVAADYLSPSFLMTCSKMVQARAAIRVLFMVRGAIPAIKPR